jgi:heme exporter protein D
MTHLPFVAAAYALGAALPILLTIEALLRLRTARRRLDAIDPRRNR